jgi:DNA-binding transcriptional regulator YiaG
MQIGGGVAKLDQAVEELKSWRLENKLSQAQAVRIFHEAGIPVSLRSLQNWEIGHRTPTALAAHTLREFIKKHPRIGRVS